MKDISFNQQTDNYCILIYNQSDEMVLKLLFYQQERLEKPLLAEL